MDVPWTESLKIIESFNILSLAASTAANFLSLPVSFLWYEAEGIAHYSLYSGSLDSDISPHSQIPDKHERTHSWPYQSSKWGCAVSCDISTGCACRKWWDIPLKSFRQAFHLVYSLMQSFVYSLGVPAGRCLYMHSSRICSREYMNGSQALVRVT